MMRLSLGTRVGIFVVVVAAGLLPGALRAQVPRSEHVFIVLGENISYNSVLGSPAAPYLNSLANQYGLATQYYANTHPSIGNYFMLTTGQIITNDDKYTGTVTADNVARRLITAGKTWKVYAESLPYAGYIGGDKYPYVKRHNPFAYFSDVRNSSMQAANIVPLAELAADTANDRLPHYSFLVPNNRSNGHDCPAGMTSCTVADRTKSYDDWLKANIGPLLASAAFQRDGILVITFDEAAFSDSANGGGRIVGLLVGPKVKPGYRSANFYQHQSTLKMMLKAAGLTSFPGAASGAADLGEFFVAPTGGCTASTVSPSVTICEPANNASSGSPVRVVAKTTSATAVNLMQVYVDGVKKYEAGASSLDVSLAMAAGARRITVQARNAAGTWFKATVYVTVQ